MAEEPPANSEGSVNRSWQIGAAAIVVGTALVAAVLGFVVVPSGDGGMSEAMGRAAEPDTDWQDTVEGITPPTEVAWTRDLVEALRTGDGANGEPLATQRCASCHGAEGISSNPTFPSLAGQPVAATYKQLRDFATGHRVSAIMSGLAQGLDQQQMIDIATFYEAREPPVSDASSGEGLVEAEELAAHGDPARGLPSCDSCHLRNGPRGTPSIAGLSETYLAAQLRAFADGGRGNDIYGLMRSISQMLTDEEIDRLAVLYGG